MSKAAKSNIVGVILAGGLSRRMGGSDKALLELGTRSMVGHVVARLGPQVGRMVLNANGDPARFAELGLPVVADTVEGFVGPLAGVLAGMRWTAANVSAATHVVTVSSDAPFLPDDLVARFEQAGKTRPEAIMLAQSDGTLHPVIGMWPVRYADDLEAALQDGVRKVLRWTDRHGTVGVAFPFVAAGGERIDPFFNANTPQELDEARRLLTLVGA